MGQICGEIANIYRDITSSNRKNSSISSSFDFVLLWCIDYWIEKLTNEITLVRRFTKAFILGGLSKISEFNYFYIANCSYHQTKRTETIFAFVRNSHKVILKKKCLLSHHRFIPKTLLTFLLETIFNF